MTQNHDTHSGNQNPADRRQSSGKPRTRRRLPKAGDIVLMRPPTPAAPKRPGPMRLPCLVLGREFKDDGEPQLLISRGTSNRNEHLYHSEILVEDRRQGPSGLMRPTKFDIAKPITIDWSREFCLIENGVPQLGRLDEQTEQQLRALYLRLLKERRDLYLGHDLLPEPPQVGDVVLLYSPYDEQPNQPGPIQHPCLVTAVKPWTDRDGKNVFLVEHAPATSNTANLGRNDLLLSDPSSLLAASLDQPTKIKLGSLKIAQWQPAYVYARIGGPKIGRLLESDFARAQAILDQMKEDKTAHAARRAPASKPGRER